jgi:hypothetical protein
LTLEEELQTTQQELSALKERVTRIKTLGLMESLAVALENLDGVKEDVKRLESVREGQDALVRAINDLTVQVSAEISSRQAQRSKENELLDQLKQYIANWR